VVYVVTVVDVALGGGAEFSTADAITAGGADGADMSISGSAVT
jgi:hypothetical protein